MNSIRDVLLASFRSTAEELGTTLQGAHLTKPPVIGRELSHNTSPPRFDEVKKTTSIALLYVRYLRWGYC